MSRPSVRLLAVTLCSSHSIEPFFFSSAVNWIPSRYQEAAQPGIGDRGSFNRPPSCPPHIFSSDITVVLPFVRAVQEAKMQPAGGLVAMLRAGFRAVTAPFIGTCFSMTHFRAHPQP